jgi:hypothetical protein
MSKPTIAMLAVVLVPAIASASGSQAVTESLPDTTGIYQSVESFQALGGLYSFRPLDNTRLVVWRTPFEPYLVELRRPSPDLRFADAVAIDSVSSTVRAKFDTVRIRGIKYPIGNIYKLSREQARAL